MLVTSRFALIVLIRMFGSRFCFELRRRTCWDRPGILRLARKLRLLPVCTADENKTFDDLDVAVAVARGHKWSLLATRPQRNSLQVIDHRICWTLAFRDSGDRLSTAAPSVQR